MASNPRSGPASQTSLDRYARNKAGESIEEIARKDRVSENAIKNSIRSIQLYRELHSTDFTNEGVNAVLQGRVRDLDKALERGLNASDTVEENGKKKKVPDVPLQLRAVGEYRALLTTVQPKVAPSVNVGVGVGVNQTTRVASGTYVGMEDRLRKITMELEGSVVEHEPKHLLRSNLGQGDDGESIEAEPVENSA